jgi:tRNA threonylcarbamoyladenosine biosynthesis protein TsaE
MEKITTSLKETEAFGKEFASTLKPGHVVLLYGDLGAGKTSLVKGIASGLGITSDITSPTFTLMNTYNTSANNIKTMVHIDTYRLKDEHDLLEIGVEDYLGKPHTICLIEWPEKIVDSLPRDRWEVRINTIGKNTRAITIDKLSSK